MDELTASISGKELSLRDLPGFETDDQLLIVSGKRLSLQFEHIHSLIDDATGADIANFLLKHGALVKQERQILTKLLKTYSSYYSFKTEIDKTCEKYETSQIRKTMSFKEKFHGADKRVEDMTEEEKEDFQKQVKDDNREIMNWISGGVLRIVLIVILFAGATLLGNVLFNSNQGDACGDLGLESNWNGSECR